jgi:hypothetical protein
VLTAGGKLLVTQFKPDQVITICDYPYFTDLYVLPLKNIEVVLGMDWMSDHGAHIDCEEKTVSIRKPGGGRITYQADKHTHVEIGIQLNTLKEAKLEDIPVVNEFMDVFPQELLGMPPDWEIEFTIDLKLGTTPISQAPYKMGPKELKELKCNWMSWKVRDLSRKEYHHGVRHLSPWTRGMEAEECVGTSEI